MHKNNLVLIQNTNGFTFIELLTSITIIAILTTLLIVNYHQYKKSSKLNFAASQIETDIRRAQNLALSSKIDKFTNKVPKGGWGIYFIKDSNKYYIFADEDGNYTYSDKDNIIATSTLADGISVENNLTVVYEPPSPKTYINGNASTNMGTIKISDGKNNSTITVNRYGLIQIE